MAKKDISISCPGGTEPYLREPTNRSSKTMWRNPVGYCKKSISSSDVETVIKKLERVESAAELVELAQKLDIPGRSKVDGGNWKKFRARWIEKLQKGKL